MAKFVKLDNFWWRYDETSAIENAKLFNPAGGEINEDISNLEIVEADGFKHLNWYGTKLYDNKYETGWLSPTGKFFGCDFEFHDMQALILHDNYNKSLERERGFIKISYDYNYRTHQKHGLIAKVYKNFLGNNLITKNQLDYLSNTNIKNYDEVELMFRMKYLTNEQSM